MTNLPNTISSKIKPYYKHLVLMPEIVTSVGINVQIHRMCTNALIIAQLIKRFTYRNRRVTCSPVLKEGPAHPSWV